MTDDIYLTVTDVAEVMQCDIAVVTALITSGQLDAIQRRGWRVSHAALSTFLSNSRRDAFDRGLSSTQAGEFAFLRPAKGDVANC